MFLLLAYKHVIGQILFLLFFKKLSYLGNFHVFAKKKNGSFILLFQPGIFIMIECI